MTIFQINYKDGDFYQVECVCQYQIDIVLKFIELNDDILNVKRIHL